MEAESKTQKEPGLKMRLCVSDGLGFDINSKLETIKFQAERRIENIEKAFLERVKSSMINIEKVLLDKLSESIDNNLSQKRRRFFESITEADELAKSSIQKIQAAASAIENSMPEVADLALSGSIQIKKNKILSDLAGVEKTALDSVDKVKRILRDIEKSSILKIEDLIMASFKKMDLNIEDVLNRNRLKFSSITSQAEKAVDAVIGKIKETIESAEGPSIEKLMAEFDSRIFSRVKDASASIAVAENNLKVAVSRSITEIERSEKSAPLRVESIADILLESKRKKWASDLRAIEEEAAAHLNKIRLIIESTEASVLEKTERSIESVLENKKARFLKGIWVGDDVGSLENPVRNVYSKGEMIGLRLESFDVVPESSPSSFGRLIFNKKEGSVYLDTGRSMKSLSSNKVLRNIFWPTGVKILEVDLSKEDMKDARDMIWQLSDTSNQSERITCKIKTPENKKLIIEVDQPLVTGSYKLIGVE